MQDTMISITHVETTPDLRYAKVYVSFLQEERVADAMKGLKSAGGWLRRQLEIQANSLSGNLDKMWPDIQDSAWIGGDREGWERVPYWLDGFIPLAYLLE